MDSIPHSEHSLPPAFRPLGGVYGKKKSMLSRIIRESINTLWDDYLKLSSILREQATLSEDSNDITRFSRLDYTKLMRILCHSFNSTDAARRIVAVHHDMQKHGIGMTRKIYEMTVQANIILGSIPESTRLYHEATTRCGVTKIEPGTREHKKLLRTMIDAFAVNRYASEGIAFLDQLPCFHPESEDPALYTHNLYSSLYLYQFRTEAKAIIQGSLTILTQESRPSLPQHLKAIRHFSGFQFLPQPIHILKTLAKLESNYNVNTDLNGANDSILAFSKTVSGMIIKCSNGCSESISPILQSLLLSDHIEEATRVLDLMLQHGFTPDIDRVRFKLLESLDTYPEKEDLMSIVEQWDAAIEKRSIAPYSKLLPNRSIAQEAPHSNNWAKEYSKFVEKCIHQNNLSGAAGVASYMSKRGWIAQGLDFQKLNSFMVNYGMSSDYITYLDVRYTLGGLLTPDIRTYRRLVYAACRRSDLITAVSLLERVRIRHPDWDLDTSVYNSIISTAAATGRIDIAEKIFTCLLENDKEPDLVTFHGLLNGYSNAKDLSAAIKIPERMVKHKLRPTTKTFNLVMKAYLGSRMDITTSSKLFNAMQLSGVGGVPPDLVTFNQLLEGYRRVGNTMWFDAYFDKYFGTESETADVPSTKGSPAPDENEELKKKKKKRKAPLIRPEKPDDSTLLIQLKHSLNLPGIDLLTVQELWRAVEPKLCPPSRSTAPEKIDDDAQIKSAKPPAKVIDPDDTLPSTNVPFKRWLGSVSMPATNREHFRFSTLNLFRTAFQSRGDLAGVKKIDGIFADLFPNHPMGQAVHYRRLVKNNRFLAKLKSLGLNQGKGQSQDENKDEDVDENVYVEEKEE
ncbi:hypothetical protein BGZ46_009063 [Entomortierella lignicola]|nr:hypothetical protein BGZ46_009063 [Entomortierella lignicola]